MAAIAKTALLSFARSSSALCPSSSFMAPPKTGLQKFARRFSWTYLTKEMKDEMPIRMWWDMDSFTPVEGQVSYAVVALKEHCRGVGLKGPVSMVAYGDTHSLSAGTTRELADAMKVNHVPKGEVLNVMSADIMEWSKDNPPPACVFIVSDNTEFIHTLNKLKPRGYATIGAAPPE